VFSAAFDLQRTRCTSKPKSPVRPCSSKKFLTQKLEKWPKIIIFAAKRLKIFIC
jgi:hypothetical protein